MKNLVVLTGAGMSAESGISTFRDAGGLWDKYPVEQVATPEGYQRDPALVINFYNARRKQLLDCLLYTSDAADDRISVDLGGRRIIKKIFFKQKTAYEIRLSLVGSEMCIRDRSDERNTSVRRIVFRMTGSKSSYGQH